MKKVCKKWKVWGLLLGLMLFAAGFAMQSTAVETQAAPRNGGHEEGHDMKKVCKKWKVWGLLLGLMLFAAGFAMQSTAVETQAAPRNGFRTVAGKTY